MFLHFVFLWIFSSLLWPITINIRTETTDLFGQTVYAYYRKVALERRFDWIPSRCLWLFGRLDFLGEISKHGGRKWERKTFSYCINIFNHRWKRKLKIFGRFSRKSDSSPSEYSLIFWSYCSLTSTLLSLKTKNRIFIARNKFWVWSSTYFNARFYKE